MPEPNRFGGGANTNRNGLLFQQTKTLEQIISEHPEFEIKGDDVFRKGTYVATLCSGHKIYAKLLKNRGINYQDLISKRIIPDDAIVVGSTVYIIEKKFQNCSGSVDEKLQTCDFKKRQYAKLLAPAGLSVEYYYVLNDWFKKKEYADVHDYIESVGCKYFFNEIPLSAIGL